MWLSLPYLKWKALASIHRCVSYLIHLFFVCLVQNTFAKGTYSSTHTCHFIYSGLKVLTKEAQFKVTPLFVLEQEH